MAIPSPDPSGAMSDDPRSAIRAPDVFKEMNASFLSQREQGELPFELHVLIVPGRRSGNPRHTPLTIHEKDGARYVVGGFPSSDWIKNVRAAGGRALLSADPDVAGEQVVLGELPPDEARPVLEACPRVMPYGTALMVENGIVAAPTPEALREVAGICPVFRIEPV